MPAKRPSQQPRSAAAARAARARVGLVPGLKSEAEYAAEQRMPDIKPLEVHGIDDPLDRQLLPSRWWEHAGQPMMAEKPTPILVVSHQVAEVLNMGIDRVVDVAARTKADLQTTRTQVELYRLHYDRLLTYLANMRTWIGPVEDNQTIIPQGGPQSFLEKLARSLDVVLEEPRP